MSKYPIKVELVGTNGNAFALIAKVRDVLRKEIGSAAAKEFADEAFDKGSYDELLRFIMETVEVV